MNLETLNQESFTFIAKQYYSFQALLQRETVASGGVVVREKIEGEDHAHPQVYRTIL